MESRLKVSFGNVAKIIKPKPHDFMTLQQQIFKKFRLFFDTYHVCYRDSEGDRVAMDEEDWIENKENLERVEIVVCI